MNSSNTNISVWLIEDNTTFRHSLSRAINRSEELSCVKEFSSFEEAALSLNPKEFPDVILLDIGLPGMNGIDALAEIRIKAPDVKVVILTAFDDNDKIFRAICAGASGYLLKTSNVGSVASAIQEAFEGGAPIPPSGCSSCASIVFTFSSFAHRRKTFPINSPREASARVAG